MRRGMITLLDWLAAPRRPIGDAACYLLLAILFYLPLIAGVATFETGDFSEHFLPFAQFLQAELSAGRVPLWNPYTYAGHPFLADIQAGVYYLPSYPFHLAGMLANYATGQLYWLQWEAIVHTAGAGLGMHWLLFTLTGTRRAAAVAGVAFMLSGFVTGYAPLQLAILRSAIWLPFAMAALWQAVHAPRQVRGWLLAALFCALIVLGGHAQTALYSAYLLVAWLIVTVWQTSLFSARDTALQQGKNRIALILGLGCVGLGTLGLSAGQLLPGWEFLNHSVRANLDFAELSGGLAVRDTWQMVLPRVFTQFSPLYVSIIGLLLALVAVFGARWGRTGAYGLVGRRGAINGRPVALFFLLVMLLGLLASYGGNAPLYPLLYWGAPGWDLFRGQERAAYIVALGLAALAGLGATWLPAAGRTLRKRSALILGGLVTVTVYGVGLLYQLLGTTAIGDYHYLWIAFYTLAFGLATCLLLWIDGWSRARSALLVLLITLNLFIANAGVNLDWIEPARRTMIPPEVRALEDVRAGALDRMDPPGRVYNEFRIPENYGISYGIEDVWGASPLRLATYDRLFDDFPLDRMWALTGVEYVLTWRRELFGPSELLAEFPQATDTTYLHRLPQVMPRAWAVETLISARENEIVTGLADHAIDLRTVAYLHALHATVSLSDGANNEWAAAEVAVLNAERGRVWIEVNAAHPAFIVVSENWMPGRTVERLVCGDSLARAGEACRAGDAEALPHGLSYLTPVPVNLTLTGLAVPGGRTRFELDYRPNSVWIGGLISGATLLLMAGVGIGGYRWRRNSIRVAELGNQPPGEEETEP